MDRDLFDFAAEINARVDDRTIRSRGQAVMDAIDAVVLDEWHRAGYPGAHGITIHVPTGSLRGRSFAYYRDLAFARAATGTNSSSATSGSGPVIRHRRPSNLNRRRPEGGRPGCGAVRGLLASRYDRAAVVRGLNRRRLGFEATG
jgi:hypothetical protein